MKQEDDISLTQLLLVTAIGFLAVLGGGTLMALSMGQIRVVNTVRDEIARKIERTEAVSDCLRFFRLKEEMRE